MIARSKFTPRVACALALFVCCGVGAAQNDSRPEDIRKQLADIQVGQKAILKELDAIRALLSGAQPAIENVPISTAGSPAMGANDSRVAIIEFSDFQCPYCAAYFSHSYPVIYNDYVKTGKVIYFFRDFPLDSLHPAAAKAAEAARCAAEQGKFREMHDRLFTNQQTLDVRYLPGHAAALGLDQAQFKTCLDSGKYAAQVKEDSEAGERLGVKGTPTFFIGTYNPSTATVSATTQLNGVQPYPAFKEVLDKLLSSK